MMLQTLQQMQLRIDLPGGCRLHTVQLYDNNSNIISQILRLILMVFSLMSSSSSSSSVISYASFITVQQKLDKPSNHVQLRYFY